MKRRVMIVAGEASGDLHGSTLIREARALEPTLQFFGICGPRMREAGAEALVDSSEMAVVGLVEIIAHFGTIRRAWQKLASVLRKDPPDLLILIDYPDFNLLLARVAKKAGVPVLYYISPQVWAWRAGRVHTIARLVDHMAVVFPFEVPFYQRAGVPVTFVGHPLVDEVGSERSVTDARSSLGLDPCRRTVGLFPGSRKSEVSRLLPVILDTARILRQRYPDLQFVLPLSPTLNSEDIQPFLEAGDLPVTVTRTCIYDVMRACDAIVSVSGTVTLEIALMEVPMVIIYRVAPLTYLVGKRLVRVDHVGLCNIVLGERVVPELLQDEAEPSRIAAELSRVLDDEGLARAVRERLSHVRVKLGSGGGSAAVARLALAMMQGATHSSGQDNGTTRQL
jgi:lipid-A-disaccharide synthase